MKVACLIATWLDGELLAEAVASAVRHVDIVLVLDGAFHDSLATDYFYTDRSRPFGGSSSDDELERARHAGAWVYPATWWRGEIEKRNVLLELGRAHVGESYWALVLDADEVLVAREHFRDFKNSCDLDDTFAPGLPRVEPDGSVMHAPSRFFHVGPFTRYRGRSYWLANPDVDLSHSPILADVAGQHPTPSAPYVEHRWDRRPEWRQEIQRRWGRELARRDGHEGA